MTVLRHDLNKNHFVPKIGAPMYYSDLAIVAAMWYAARLSETGEFPFKVNYQNIGNLSATLKSGFISLNATALVDTYQYFVGHSEFNYEEMADFFKWKPDTEENDLQIQYNSLIESGARISAVCLAKTLWLVYHYVYARLGKKMEQAEWFRSFKLTENEWLNFLKPPYDVIGANAFIQACMQHERNMPMLTFWYAFLSVIPVSNFPLSTSRMALSNREWWLSPLINLGDLTPLKLYNFNRIPNEDWLVFPS